MIDVSYMVEVHVNSRLSQFEVATLKVQTKLMGLEVTNQIVNNSDSKLADFDRRFGSDSKSNDEFESTIAI